MERDFVMRILSRISSRLLAGSMVLSVGALWPIVASQKGYADGTDLGNAKFVEYSNQIYGVSFLYPSLWNLVDAGQSVNIVAYQPENGRFENGRLTEDSLGLPESIDLLFEDRYSFPTYLSFDKFVRNQNPLLSWEQVRFKGLAALKSKQANQVIMYLLKADRSAVRISYPVDFTTGAPGPLVEKTISSITFSGGASQ
jgi:hypothetical protein